MQKRLLGKTGYQVSAVVYGGIISMNEDQATSDRYVSWAIDQGVNYFDVAPTYGDAEEKLGNSLKPYRKNVYLACKTTERMRTEAEKELQQSMKLLHTDYFDNFQLHSMTKPEDVEKAFGPGGIMELLIPLKEKGVIRKLGFSAHSETAALKCLDLYDFDTVLFPMNYMLDMNEGIGKELAQEAKKKGFGLLGMKNLVDRAWKDDSERKSSNYPKSWCKPFDVNQKELRIAAMKYSLAMGSDVLVPPGNWENFSFMVRHADECLTNPLSDVDIQLLQQHFQLVKGMPFFKKDNGGWPVEA
jgi:aryl-alcohol dehydrogenase-like predicted oxidoreductase